MLSQYKEEKLKRKERIGAILGASLVVVACFMWLLVIYVI
jgi:hypothetical protein